MVNFPNWIPDCYSHNPALCFYFFLVMLVFVLQWLSLHREIISVSIDSLSNTKHDTPFHSIAHYYSDVEWDGFCDHLRDVPWEDIFKFSASAAASEFC